MDDLSDVANLSSIQSASGTYYNSVTDTYDAVPAGAPNYGNEQSPQQTQVEKEFSEIGSGIAVAGSTVVQGVKKVGSGLGSVVTSVESGVSSGFSFVEHQAVMGILLVVGAVALLVWVAGKSGAVSISKVSPV